MVRESIDTTGLIVVKHSVEPDPHADFEGHGPTHVVETQHEIADGETVGELLARLKLDEGDRIELRWPTWQEEIAPAVAKLTEIVQATLCPICSTALIAGHCPTPACQPPNDDVELVERDADGNPPPFESFPELNVDRESAPWPDYRDERTASR